MGVIWNQLDLSRSYERLLQIGSGLVSPRTAVRLFRSLHARLHTLLLKWSTSLHTVWPSSPFSIYLFLLNLQFMQFITLIQSFTFCRGRLHHTVTLLTPISYLKPGILNRRLYAFTCSTAGCLDMGELEWGFMQDSAGTRILHHCNNHNGHAPTITLIPRFLPHTHSTLCTHRNSLSHTHTGNHFHTYFLCIYIPLSFICVHKNKTKAF